MLAFPGTRRFEILRKLGTGGMGVVFEAYDREHGTPCALKLLPSTSPDALVRFKNEFRILQGLHHPNLVTLGERLSDEGHWFFTMELVAGVDFMTHVRIRDTRYEPTVPSMDVTCSNTDVGPEPQASRLAPAHPLPPFDEPRLTAALVQLAEGLRYLHDSGKVHRDVKPSNVLVTPEGRVVLLDFGLVADLAAASAASRSPVVSVAGTPEYMAPEQRAGATVGPPADMYAFGIMLFRAL